MGRFRSGVGLGLDHLDSNKNVINFHGILICSLVKSWVILEHFGLTIIPGVLNTLSEAQLDAAMQS